MNNNFVFMTDDSCDLPSEYLVNHNIETIKLSYSIDSVEYRAGDISPKEFFDLVRQGKMPITAQVNMEDMRTFMEKFLKQGKDLLYIGFSSGLSGTCNSGMMAIAELKKEYPERQLIAVDSLAASLGQGLIIHKANRLREEGKSMQEIAKWVEDNRDNVVHMVAVDDLMHLHRGGRVSAMSAIAGSVLGIKPIIHLDIDGKLKVIGKARGRKQALINVVNRVKECVGDVSNDIFMICHGDCEDDANFVADMITKQFGVQNHLINYVGPVIGSHTGAGVLAVFMMGKHK